MANQAKDQAQRLTDYAYGQGGPLDEELNTYSDQQRNKENEAGDYAQQYYIAQLKSQGYTPEQIQGILGQSGTGNVPGLDQLTGISGAEQTSNFLTPAEAVGIAGNPNKPLDYLHSDTIGQYMQEGDTAQNKAVAGEKEALAAGIDPSKLALGSRYGADTTGQVGKTGAKLDTITGNPNLDFTKQQQQDIEEAASRNVGQISQANLEDIERRNQAAGLGIQGMNATRARMSRDAASAGAAAATNARIQGAALGLSAAQQKAGLQTGATEYTGTQGLSALQDIENKRLGAEQYLSGAEEQAATEGGRQDIANQQQETGQNIGAVENVRNAEVAAHQTAEQQAATRAASLGTNRQTTQQANNATGYNRNLTANQLLSQRYGDVGKTQLGQQNTGASGLQGQQQIEATNQNTAVNQKIQNEAVTGGLAGEAANTTANVQATPGLGSQILGGIIGAGTAALTKFDDGGIADEPTEATLGETGPEMVVPLEDQGGNKPVSWRNNLRNAAGDIGKAAVGGFMHPLGLRTRYGGSPMPSMPGSNLGAPPMPDSSMHLEDGGIINNPTVATLGENGPERVTPLSDPRGTTPVGGVAELGSSLAGLDAGGQQAQGQAPGDVSQFVNKGPLRDWTQPQTGAVAVGGGGGGPTTKPVAPQAPAAPPVASPSVPAQAGQSQMQRSTLPVDPNGITQLNPGRSFFASNQTRTAQPQYRQQSGQSPWGSQRYGQDGGQARPWGQQRYQANNERPQADWRSQRRGPIQGRYGEGPPTPTPQAGAGVLSRSTVTANNPAPPQIEQPENAGGFFGGGLITKPTRAILGENGPEAVIPLHQRPGMRMRPSAMSARY